jgi:hypothetical protein
LNSTLLLFTILSAWDRCPETASCRALLSLSIFAFKVDTSKVWIASAVLVSGSEQVEATGSEEAKVEAVGSEIRLASSEAAGSEIRLASSEGSKIRSAALEV